MKFRIEIEEDVPIVIFDGKYTIGTPTTALVTKIGETGVFGEEAGIIFDFLALDDEDCHDSILGLLLALWREAEMGEMAESKIRFRIKRNGHLAELVKSCKLDRVIQVEWVDANTP